MKRFKNSVYLFPGLLLVVVFMIIPLVITIMPTFINNGITFTNYTSVLTDPFYQSILIRTIRIGLVTTLICLVLGFPTAYFIVTGSELRRKLTMALVLFPLFTNAVIRGFAWITILGKNGFLNQTLLNFNLIQEPIGFMYTEFSIIIGSVYLFLPVMVNTLVSVLSKVDGKLVEAAQTLGAKSGAIFKEIVLPLTFPGIVLGSVLVFTGTISAYVTPSLLGGNKNMMLSTLLYQQSNELMNWQSASVFAFIMILLSAGIMKLMTYLSHKVDQRGMSHE
ncbi:ABC transporter permease subunit [Erysipelothrix rhusiopathiae]|uniref:ABC transporter permease n=1 Tax=Erysipelothrix sp. strain 2 (EsS2-7-Brazil) TaxID=2500579 RepID=UPI0013771C41|nr:ABC transporter permease [Erysipelothrix sp. strain 2 (EsS2-7-Brazil)]MBK2403385.1 ABC transporter permease [Erysipelothrix sp. strain 2 (EsS2-7-Brazil)]NBA00647.1 ABC transporter permease subunit [Erysipelothrix rhusiopathiae]